MLTYKTKWELYDWYVFADNIDGVLFNKYQNTRQKR